MPVPLCEKSSGRPTMRQIAAAVGVSVMTVSRALRNNPKISPEVRAKIHKVALDLGYRPDPEVVKLMNHLRRRGKPTLVAGIAAITSIPAEIEPTFLKRARENAQARAAELGYTFEVFHIEAPEKFNRALQRTLVSRGIEGVVLLQMHAPARVETLLDWDRFSVVAATPSVLSPEFPRVLAHHFHNARLLCDELARRGCERIGFVGPETFCVRTRHAVAAAVAWQGAANGGTAVRPLIFADAEPAEESLVRWFKRERPDAIIAHAETALPYIADTLKLSADPKFVLACTNIDPAVPQACGIDERHDLIGRKAIDVLTSLLNRNEKNLRATHTSTLIEGRWAEPS